MLIALDFHFGPVLEFAIVGSPDADEGRRVLRRIHGEFRPGKVVAWKTVDEDVAKLNEIVPLLAGKTAQGAVTVYLCRDFACQAPVVGATAFDAALRAAP